MNVLYVASDREGAGKTALCASLAREIGWRGTSVAVFKPVAGAGLRATSDPDRDCYRKVWGRGVEGWPLDPPGDGIAPGFLDAIREVFGRLVEGVDVVVVEGSCGLSPEDSRRVADALDAKVLFLAAYRHDLSAARLKEWTSPFGDDLLGIVVNGLTRYRGTEARTRLLPTMKSEGLVSLGVIPEDRRLLGVTVGQLAEHLEARFVICEERSDALIEHLMVGGMSMDPGELLFGLRDGKAVIVRGDRPDIQMAALATPTSCLVLTQGIEPIEYVRHEAEQAGVAVLVVQGDTLGTMDALNTLADRARFDHLLKLERFVELVRQHVDLPTLLEGMGLGG